MNEKKTVSTCEAPKAIGPYSAGIEANGFIFTSGQLPVDPTTNELIVGTAGDMTRRCMDNVAAILKAAGTGVEGIVKTTIFLADLADFAAVNEAYGEYFKSAPPASSCIQVAKLPKNARIEIEAVALK